MLGGAGEPRQCQCGDYECETQSVVSSAIVFAHTTTHSTHLTNIKKGKIPLTLYFAHNNLTISTDIFYLDKKRRSQPSTMRIVIARIWKWIEEIVCCLQPFWWLWSIRDRFTLLIPTHDTVPNGHIAQNISISRFIYLLMFVHNRSMVCLLILFTNWIAIIKM